MHSALKTGNAVMYGFESVITFAPNLFENGFDIHFKQMYIKVVKTG